MAREGEDKVTSLRVDKELWKEGKIYAIENGLTMGEFVEKLLRRELKKRRLESERKE